MLKLTWLHTITITYRLTVMIKHVHTCTCVYTVCVSAVLQVASIDQLALHFALDSNLLHSESDEAQRQLARDEGAGTTTCMYSFPLHH